jgi:hypothetical protein
LPALALVKKESVSASNSSESMVHGDVAALAGTLAHQEAMLPQTVAINASDSSVNVQVHMPGHVTYQGDAGMSDSAVAAALQMSTGMSLAITKTEDGGRMVVAYGDDGRPLTKMEEDMTSHYSDSAQLRLQQDQPSDVGYPSEGGESLAYAGGVAGTFPEENRTPSYLEDTSRVQVAYMEDGTRVHLVYEQEGDSNVAVAYTEDGRRITVPYTIETVPQAELEKVAAGRLRQDGARGNAHNLGEAGASQSQQQQQNYASYSQTVNAQSLNDGSGNLDIKSGRALYGMKNSSEQGSSGVVLPVSMVGVGHGGDLAMTTLPQTGLIEACTISHSDYARLGTGSAATQFPETVTLLPQTGHVQAINLSQTQSLPLSRLSRPSSSGRRGSGVMQAPPADDINMRMMAAAAELMSQSTQPVDDVNMRLMAETADYISRSAQQSATTPRATGTGWCSMVSSV